MNWGRYCQEKYDACYSDLRFKGPTRRLSPNLIISEVGECCKVITIKKKKKDAIRLTSDNNESFISNCAS